MDTPTDLNQIHILFVLEKPENDEKKWKDFLHYTVNPVPAWPPEGTAPPETKKSKIAENVWLCPLKSGLPFLGRLAAAAAHAGIPYKYLVFQSEPTWVFAGDITSLGDGSTLRTVR